MTFVYCNLNVKKDIDDLISSIQAFFNKLPQL